MENKNNTKRVVVDGCVGGWMGRRWTKKMDDEDERAGEREGGR